MSFPAEKIRVLVVDDSVVIRRLLTDILRADEEIDVVGTAPNGRIALAKLPQLNPDLVTLDIEMPELDGLSTLPELRRQYPRLPVIMFSTLTERGAVATLEALTRGASDYVAKPANVGSVTAAMESVKEQLIPKIKSLCHRAAPAAAAPVRAKVLGDDCAVPRPPRRDGQMLEAIVIGCSTGGPQALAALLGGLPGDLPVGVAVVQHMPPIFTRHLADRLNADCALEVSEAREGDVMRRGRVLIAPGDHHLVLRRSGAHLCCTLNQDPPENSCRPAVDVLFHSAADVCGAGCLGAVLTGMGTDGLRGSKRIVSRGGRVLVQNQASCVVWGMPRAVAEAGLADAAMPIGELAGELNRSARVGRRQAKVP